MSANSAALKQDITEKNNSIDETIRINKSPQPAHLVDKGFQPGISGNPKGRPKGSRSKLSEKFLAATLKAFKAHGDQALEDMALKHPEKFCSMISAILPKDFQVSVLDETNTRWVVSSQPLSTELEWKERHGLRDDSVVIDQDKPVDSSG